MRLSKAIATLCASATLVLSAAAAPAQAPGMAVKHTSGAAVGTVQAVEDGFYVVKTNKHEVRLPANAFTPHEGALLFAMTQDELNAQIEAAAAQAQAQIAPGAQVRGTGGDVIAAIDAVDDQFVTLKLSTGELVKLPKEGIAAGPEGPMIGMTGAELRAAAGL